MPATATDAQLILQLYDIRRENLMRKAREFVTGQFWPQSAEDVVALIRNFGSQENAYFRQVIGYWEMAAAMVNRGAIDSDLFCESNGENIFVFGKLQPHLEKARELMGSGDFLRQTEQLIKNSPIAQKQLERVLKNIAARPSQQNQAAKA